MNAYRHFDTITGSEFYFVLFFYNSVSSMGKSMFFVEFNFFCSFLVLEQLTVKYFLRTGYIAAAILYKLTWLDVMDEAYRDEKLAMLRAYKNYDYAVHDDMTL